MSDAKSNDEAASSLTVHDYFAAAVIQGIIASGKYVSSEWSKTAMDVADELCAEREIREAPAQPAPYDPTFGDDRICRCGHTYHRHFDSYEGMKPVGCKYCDCTKFIESAKPACPICGGTEFADPLPGTVGRMCVKCCGAQVKPSLPPGYTLPAGYEWTGEIRPPRKGEWYIGIQLAIKCSFDGSSEDFPIIRPIVPAPESKPASDKEYISPQPPPGYVIPFGYEYRGEFRNPEIGEWFISDLDGTAIQSSAREGLRHIIHPGHVRPEKPASEQWPECDEDVLHINAFSPLPWRVDGYSIIDSTGCFVGNFSNRPIAPHIVRAVNAHEILMAVAKAWVQHFDFLTQEHEGDGEYVKAVIENHNARVEATRKAIRLAEGTVQS